MTNGELMERLADKEHDSWARWMTYLFSTCDYLEDGTAVIPSGLFERWCRQMTTPYGALTETEKESDRNEVRRILPLIEDYARAAGGRI